MRSRGPAGHGLFKQVLPLCQLLQSVRECPILLLQPMLPPVVNVLWP